MAAGGAYLVYKYRLRVSLLHYIVFAELNAFFFFFFQFFSGFFICACAALFKLCHYFYDLKL